MVEAFSNESPGREQNPRRVGRQRIQFGDQIRTLLSRHAPMQYEGCQFVFFQRAADIFQMIGTLCQHQYLATVVDGALRFIGNRGCSILIFSEGSEYLLNADSVRQ